MLAILAFLRSPLGKYGLIALAVLAFVGITYAKGRGDAHKADLPRMVDPVTKKAWMDEAQAAILDLGTCRANTVTLQSALERQNASIEAARVEGERRAKMLVEGLQHARAGRATAEARAAALVKTPPAGIDACARSEAARRAVLESLK